MKNSVLLALFLLNFAVIFAAESASAQAISLNLSGQTVREADDYFTDVLQDAKDFNSNCDIGNEQARYFPKSVTNGIWTGVHPGGTGPIVGLLPIPTTGTNITVFREDCQSLGLHSGKAVDTSKYRRVSWKMRNSTPSSIAFLWTTTSNYAIDGFSEYDGYFLPADGVQTPANQWVVKNFFLPTRALSSYPWTGNVTGISMWPSAYQPVNGTTSLDWFRLSDPDSATNIPVSWTTSGVSGSNLIVSLWIDNDSQDYDGVAVNRLLSASGSTNFDTGILPPGTYYVYAQLESHNNYVPTLLARSSYRGPIVINGKPILKFTAPSRMSGSEYSRDELGDVWDMNNAQDVVNIVDANGNPTPPIYRGLHDAVFTNGYFFATSDYDPVGFTVDTQVHFNVPRNLPVDTNYYRYFCYRMQVDPVNLARDGNWEQQNAAGWVARLHWVRRAVATGWGESYAHEIVEATPSFPDLQIGLVTYCFDMWNEATRESGMGWRQMRYADIIRFDPLEARPETRFAIDWAGLFAENEETSNHLYRISWNLNDSENDASTISFYYDNNNSGYDGTLINTLTSQHNGDSSFVWSTAGVTEGRYYLYAVVTDSAGNVSRYYSDVDVKIGGVLGKTIANAVDCDVDGDSKSDFSAVRGGSNGAATIYTKRSSDGASSTSVQGDVDESIFSAGDFDGDLISDLGFARTLTGTALRWIHIISSSGATDTIELGTKGDIPLTPDIDGDGLVDQTAFHSADGTWRFSRSYLGDLTFQWGQNGDLPVPADYDGDNWDDIAVFRPLTGEWLILLSSRGASKDPADVLVRQWGLSGDHPMPGDYDGDRKADLVVFRASEGNWYKCLSSTNFDCSLGTSENLGLPGDRPVRGDFDGDGKLDLAIRRASSSYWEYRSSATNSFVATQFGTSSDIPICMGVSQIVEVMSSAATSPSPSQPKKKKKKKKKKSSKR